MAARALWSRAAFKQGVQLLSLGATNFVDIAEHQQNLFDSVPVKPQGELNDVLDRITEAIGPGHRRSMERGSLTQQDKQGEK